METATAVAARSHVAGPPEKAPTPNRKAGWEWVQQCLRCDALLGASGVWFLLGATVYELTDGRMTTEPPPDAHAESAARCQPKD